MATKTIAWTTGSGNITLIYTGQGSGAISVASDENDLFEDREQSFDIVTTNGTPEQAVSILVKQKGKSYAVGTVLNFDYTGSVQQVKLPKGKYKLQCWGAQGGTNGGTGSKGGYSEGIITLTSTTTLYVFVGGQGGRSGNGGWNGGGRSTGHSSYTSGNEYGESSMASGGGATDISTVTSDMSYSSGRTNRSSASLLARCIVAGGGAGGSSYYQEITDTYSEWVSVDSGSADIYWFDGSDRTVYTYYCYANIEAGKTYRLGCSVSGDFDMSFYKNGSYVAGADNVDSGFTAPSVDFDHAECNCRLPKGTILDSYPTFYIEKYETYSTTDSYSDSSSQSQQGGGTSGKGQYPGTQTSAGSGGGFGYGANQETTNYMYCSGGGGGGWYGGGSGRADGSTGYINYSGGGSGFVNTSANASSRPSGYTGLQLDSGTTTAGNASHPSTSGVTETGHSGNGYARITILDPNYVPDPLEDYTLLSYIQSSGSQYINTGVYPNKNTRVAIDFALTKTTTLQRIIGNKDSSSTDFVFEGYINGSGYFAWSCVNGNGNWTSMGYKANTNRHQIDLDSYNNTVKLDGGSLYSATISTTRTKTSAYPICIANTYYSTSGYVTDRAASMKIYSCQIYESGTLVRDYIPVKRNSDGVCGLWDKVNEVFYKSGSGTNFTGA